MEATSIHGPEIGVSLNVSIPLFHLRRFEYSGIDRIGVKKNKIKLRFFRTENPTAFRRDAITPSPQGKIQFSRETILREIRQFC